MTPQQAARFMRRIGECVENDDGCWIWQGKRDRYGYGVVIIDRRQTGTHRAAWLALRGDIPDGLVVDHLCRVRACANPWHMDLVTSRVNTQRGEMKPGPGGSRKTHCIAGHPLSGDNLYERPGKYRHRTCRICARERVRAYKARHAA